MVKISSVFNMFGLQEGGFNLVFVIPVAAVLVAVNLLFKFSSRKPEITKKTQTAKKQKVASKQKDEKQNVEKKGKTKQEKKTLPSSEKDLETSSDTIKTKPNKKQLAHDKSPKKNSPTNVKTIVNPPIKTKKSEKLLKSLINKEEEGEWQTVVKKKQKQTKSDEIVESDVPNKSKKSPEKHRKNKNKTVVNEEETKPLEIIDLVQSNPLVQNQEDDWSKFTDNTLKPTAYVSNKVALIEGSEDNTLIGTNVSTANVAFDELGDDVWTNNKPQKKNRKKALRE